MGHNWLIFSIVILTYGVGFVGTVSARTWMGLGVRFLISLGIVVGLLFWASSGGGLVVFIFIFIFSFPILLFAAGAVSGVATRAALLRLRWGARSGKGILVILTGLSALPAGTAAYGVYRQWESRALYAALPTADSLPAIPACDPFRQTGPMIGAVMTEPRRDASSRTIPFNDTRVLYPAVYRDPYPPRSPKSDEKVSWISFKMYVEGARPVPPEDIKDADGKWIPLNKRQPSIRFHFRSRAPIAEHAIRMLNITSGNTTRLDDVPDIRLAPSSHDGLSLVVSPQPRSIDHSKKSFVAIRDGLIDELVQCSGNGTFPQCTFTLDESGITLEGTFAETSFVDWLLIRKDVKNFASCSVAAARQGAR